MELATGVAPVQDGRIHIEKINAPFLFTLKAKSSEVGAGLEFALEPGWLELHESGTYVWILAQGIDCFRVSKATAPIATPPATHRDRSPDKAMQGASASLRDTKYIASIAYLRAADHESTVASNHLEPPASQANC